MLEPDQKPIILEMEARCRKCDQCLAHRRNLWTARAIDETKWSNRTWFGTLTVAPEHRFRLSMMAEKSALRAGGETLSSLSSTEQFRILAGQLGKEATKYLKRVRASGCGPLRYLLVSEAHKDGFPHLHFLVHEKGEPVTKRVLDSRWGLGFVKVKLVDHDPRVVGYVCKYLAKSALTRVRASTRYGQPDLRQITEAIHKMADALRSPHGSERTTPPSKESESERTHPPPMNEKLTLQFSFIHSLSSWN